MLRLRQIAMVAPDLAAVEAQVGRIAGVDVCYRDPGVGKYSLHNALWALGGTFLEALAPTQPDTTAGRYMARRSGATGYMVILDSSDLDAVRARLAPFIAALPGATAINVNTAPAEVLAALVEGLDLDAARMLVARRNTGYFRTTAEFLAQLPKDVRVSEPDIRVDSDYFLATLRVTSGSAEVRGRALFARRDAQRWPGMVRP